MATPYDAIAIGSGQAGPFLAARLAKAGRLAAMAADVSYKVMRDTMHIHPTVSEPISTLLGQLVPLDPA